MASTNDGPTPTTTPAKAGTVTAAAVKPATAATTSLPFTGADVEGLAVVGGAAVLAGALLLRRRRHTA